MAGPWKVIVSARGPHTLRMTGISGLSFTHGFSQHSTLNINETSNRPIKGKTTFILLCDYRLVVSTLNLNKLDTHFYVGELVLK